MSRISSNKEFYISRESGALCAGGRVAFESLFETTISFIEDHANKCGGL